MSADDNEQLGAEPAIETRGRRPRRGPAGARNTSTAVAGESEPREPTAALDELREMTA